jgi:uracil-DNA glycosylase family 4
MQCPCHLGMKGYVPPSGPRHTRLYIAGMAPGRNEVIQGQPFVGDSGTVLRQALRDCQIDPDTEVRFFNVVACRTTQEENPNANRDPTEEEVENCRELIYNDILKTKPEMILCMGEKAASGFFNIKGKKVKDLLNVRFEWRGIPVRVAYHPSYILRQGGIGTSEYEDYVNFLAQFSTKVAEYHTFLKSCKVLTPQEFLDWEPWSNHLGFDIEATKLQTVNADFQICGLGFSNLEGDAIYVDTRNGDADLTIIAPKFIQIVKTCVLYVFNLSFEATAFATKLQLHPYELNVVDARQTALVTALKGNLKDIAARHKFPNWEIDMFTAVEWLKTIRKSLRKNRKKAGLIQFRESWEAYKQFLETEKQLEVLEAATQLEALYEHPDAGWGLDRVRKVFLEEVDGGYQRDAHYDLVPLQITAPYCGYDAFAARKLHEDWYNAFDADEKKAFHYLMEHAELGAVVTSTGVGWNFEKARELDIFYMEQLIDSLKKFLCNEYVTKALALSDHTLVTIKSTTDWEELKKIYNPNSNHVNTRTAFINMLDYPFLRRCWALYQLYLKVNNTPETEWKDLKDVFVSLLKEPKEEEFPEIKELSAEERDRFMEERLKEARAEKRKWVMDEEEQIRNIIESYCPTVDEEQPSSKRSSKYSKYYEYKARKQAEDVADSKKFIALLDKLDLDKMDEKVIVPLYEACTKIGGVDIDDKSTWFTEFYVLYYFRRYRKILKCYSTYLWGKIGMEEAAQIVKKNQRDFVSPPRLMPNWEKAIADNYLSDKYLPLVTWPFNVNGAGTNRWTSQYHTVPWNCELQDLKTSRYENGLLAHCDYSQQEVRTIAALAGETGLLQAYKEGKDVHRYMASRIFQKPEEDITETERRYSKMLTFSLLYGKSAAGIARDFMNGDLKRANKLVDDFFNGFPKIDAFVKAMHARIEKGETFIRSILGEKINILGDRSKNSEFEEMKRCSVNYPIQSSASHITAIGINRVGKAAYRQKLPIRVFGFTHDAGDFDFKADYLFEFISILHHYMQDEISEEFNIPVQVDMEIGVTGDNMLKMKFKEISKDKIVAKVSGSQQALNDVQAVFDRMKMPYELEVTEVKDEFHSQQALFQAKRAFSAKLGKTLPEIGANLIVFNAHLLAA